MEIQGLDCVSCIVVTFLTTNNKIVSMSNDSNSAFNSQKTLSVLTDRKIDVADFTASILSNLTKEISEGILLSRASDTCQNIPSPPRFFVRLLVTEEDEAQQCSRLHTVQTQKYIQKKHRRNLSLGGNWSLPGNWGGPTVYGFTYMKFEFTLTCSTKYIICRPCLLSYLCPGRALGSSRRQP